MALLTPSNQPTAGKIRHPTNRYQAEEFVARTTSEGTRPEPTVNGNCWIHLRGCMVLLRAVFHLSRNYRSSPPRKTWCFTTADLKLRPKATRTTRQEEAAGIDTQMSAIKAKSKPKITPLSAALPITLCNALASRPIRSPDYRHFESGLRVPL